MMRCSSSMRWLARVQKTISCGIIGGVSRSNAELTTLRRYYWVTKTPAMSDSRQPSLYALVDDGFATAYTPSQLWCAASVALQLCHVNICHQVFVVLASRPFTLSDADAFAHSRNISKKNTQQPLL